MNLLRLINVPKCLQYSQLFRNFADNCDDKNDEIIVPSEFLVENFILKSPADVKNCIEILNYWNFLENEIPFEFYEACIKNRNFLDLELLDKCYGQHFLKKQIILIKNHDDENLCQVASNEHEFELMIAANKCGCPLDPKSFEKAILKEHIECIDYVLSVNVSWRNYTCSVAVYCRLNKCLNYLVEKGYYSSCLQLKNAE
jgi:hypothetical protein